MFLNLSHLEVEGKSRDLLRVPYLVVVLLYCDLIRLLVLLYFTIMPRQDDTGWRGGQTLGGQGTRVKDKDGITAAHSKTPACINPPSASHFSRRPFSYRDTFPCTSL